MESKIIYHEKAVIPWFKEFPVEATETWDRAKHDSIPKTLKAICKDVPDDEAFRKKRAEPLLAAIDKMLKPDFVSKKGLSKNATMALARAKLYGTDTAKKYKKHVSKGVKIFDQGERNSDKAEYHRSKSFGDYRFTDAIELTKNFLTSPLIFLPGKTGRFRLKFVNQFLSSGILISNLAYGPEYTKSENDKFTRLLNECGYLEKNLVPFSTGGESHFDIGLILNSGRPTDSREVKEIVYEIYKRFKGEEFANNLWSRWTVKDYQYPLNPDDYIGNINKPAYFDMELDIQVSEKD